MPRSNSEAWAGAMLLVTCGVLLLAVVGAVCRTGAKRAWWLGFALFGWGYLVLLYHVEWTASGIGRDRQDLPTGFLLKVLEPFIVGPKWINVPRWNEPYFRAGHHLWALVAAVMGGLLGRVLFGAPAAPEEATTEPSAQSQPRWSRRRRVLGALAGYAAVGSLFLIGVRLAPAFSAGAVFLVTWGLIGLAAVGAVCDRGRRRAAGLGAALFGAGFMILVVGREPGSDNWPHLAASHPFASLRGRFGGVLPLPSGRIVAANSRIRKALEEPIPMSFPNECPLEDVLKYITSATAGLTDTGIPIYVDPAGLRKVGRTMTDPVTLDLEGVPLKTALRLLLSSLGLKYSISEGFLEITAQDPVPLANPEDPFLISAHCYLALAAAGLGAVLAPLVCGLTDPSIG